MSFANMVEWERWKSNFTFLNMKYWDSKLILKNETFYRPTQTSLNSKIILLWNLCVRARVCTHLEIAFVTNALFQIWFFYCHFKTFPKVIYHYQEFYSIWNKLTCKIYLLSLNMEKLQIFHLYFQTIMTK